jgi:D-alanyl-D-alanine carboxypeptidase
MGKGRPVSGRHRCGQAFRLGCIPAILGLLLASTSVAPARALESSSIVIDEASGKVLHGYRVDAAHAPASLTKMMTLFLAFEALERGRLRLAQPVTISVHAATRAPSKMYFRAGQRVTVENLMLAVALKSANDAAAALAEAIGGSEARFAQMMTAKAREIGMTQTTFMTASGLPAAGQLTTARDMAILTRAVHLRYPLQYQAYLGRRYAVAAQRHIANTNRLLHTNPEVDGGKTGFTRAAGYNLATTAQRDGRKVIVVVLGARSSSERFYRTERLMAAVFGDEPAKGTLLADGRAKTLHDNKPGRLAAAFIGRAEASERTDRPAAGPAAEGERAPARATVIANAPKPRIVYTRSTAYAVQLASYGRYNQARNAATAAVRQLPAQARKNARITVVAVRAGKRPAYAARLTGMRLADARLACQTLKRRGMACQPLAYTVQHATIDTSVPDTPPPAAERESDEGDPPPVQPPAIATPPAERESLR